MIRHKTLAALAIAALLIGCAPAPLPDVTRLIEPTILEKTDATAADVAPGACWAKVQTEDTETVTESTLVVPETLDDDGTVLSPAIHRTVERPVDGSKEVWFERPCEAQITPDLTASLQRALKAREFYVGEITGEMDEDTRLAIRIYQQAQGIDSGVLSMATARQLGLITVDLDHATDQG